MTPITHKTFFDGYRQSFGALVQTQVAGLVFLLGKFATDSRWQMTEQVAYALATIHHETDMTFQPIEERGGNVYLSKYFLKPSLRAALGNLKLSDAWVFKGRGFVMITGRRNYTVFSTMVTSGIDLTSSPERACEPEAAYQIMTVGMMRGLFTTVSLPRYVSGATNKDYRNARRVINGLDRADLIANYARTYERLLRSAQN